MGPDLNIYFISILFYLVGSLPFALIIHSLMSTSDPRETGSKNPGATNMYRVAGPLAGVMTFIGDFLKGFIPIFLLIHSDPTSLYVMSFFILAGHMFSIFNKFQGGKGVATSFGSLLAINLTLGVTLMIVWLAVFLLKRISGLAAIISFIFLPLIVYLIMGSYEFLIVSIIHSVIILINHRNNINGRLSEFCLF